MGFADHQPRVCHTLCLQTPIVHHSHFSGVATPAASTGHSGSVRQAGGGKGLEPELSRLLQPALSGSQEERPVASGNRLVRPQFICGTTTLQDGNSGFHQGVDSAWTLGYLYGSLGRIFSRPHPSQFPEVPSVLFQRPSLSVPGSSLRTSHCPPGVHQDHGGRRCTSASEGLDSSSILRRLAASPSTTSSIVDGPQDVVVRHSVPRTSPESGQVRTSTIPELHVRWDQLSDGRQRSAGTPAQSSVHSEPSDNGDGSIPFVGQGVSFSSGSIERCGGSGLPWSSSSTTNPVLPTGSLASPLRPTDRLDPHSASSVASSTVVDVPYQVRHRGTPDSPLSISSAGHGCQSEWLGRPPGTSGSHGVRRLDFGRTLSPHQQPRDAGSSPCNLPLSTASRGPLCASVFGQHHSRLLCESPRGNSFPIALSRDEAPLLHVSGLSGNSVVTAHSRQIECPRRQSISLTSTSAVRVVSSPSGGGTDISSAGAPHGGPVCNTVQSSAAPVCQSSDGSPCHGSRRHVVQLGRPGRIRLSTVLPPTADSAEDSLQPLSGASNCPVVASESVVLGPSGTSSGSSQKPSNTSRPSSSKRLSSHQSRPVPTTRLAVIRQALRKKCFSSRASSLISTARRKSTRTVYDAKWKVFTDWCDRRQINPLDPSPRRIADFLIYLFDTKHLSVSTIKGYRSTISHTLAFRKASKVCADPSISELIRAFELRRPVSRSLTPKWDLSCVLWSLTKAPYEPLDQASLQFLTWKTVFLLTLASAKRRSEIHALSVEDGHLRFNDADGSVSLLSQAGFLSKTQLPSVASSPFTIPALSSTCGRDDPDRLLCPVRALRFYLQRVKTLRGHRKRLFIPIKGGGDVSASSISRWIASTIRKAYASLTDSEVSFLQIRPHELRALASSWAFVNYTPLEEILKATFWKNSSTFSSFYLRSFQCQKDNLWMLGPLVVAGAVITSSS